MIQDTARTITKEEIAHLPIETYKGRIITIISESDANKAVAYLREFPVVGFDTETRPSFKKGQHYKVSLIQISTEDTCFLFRLNYLKGIPASLLNFLNSEETIKVGLSLRDDFGAIRKRSALNPGNFIDLQDFVKPFGIQEASLQKIYATLRGARRLGLPENLQLLELNNIMKLSKVYLKPKKEESLLRFHPWVFSGAIQTIDGQPEEGDLVEVYGANNQFLAIGHYQIGSIAVRVLSFQQREIDQAFWAERVRQAYTLRQALGLTAHPERHNTFRLIHGEGDNLPGLVVDLYAHTAVMQAHSVGMHYARHQIAEALKEVLGDRLQNIYYKSETTLPYKANLGSEDGYLMGGDDEETALENGLRFYVDWQKGQKTGFFVDQRENRSLLERYAKGRDVLNMFCYTGGFSFYAMRGGAKTVHSVDSSAKAIMLTNKNVELNFPNDPRHEAYAVDAFKYLEQMGHNYDLIILDPPAFAKHKNVLRNALQGYRKLNAIAFEKIKPGGILFTFSCSQVVSKENFRLAVFSAAAQSGRNVRILHQLTQPADHPVNIYHPEGEYLKGLVLYVE